MAVKKFKDLKKSAFFILKKELDKALKPHSKTKPGVYIKEENTFGDTKYWGRMHDSNSGIDLKGDEDVVEVDAV